MVMSLSRVANTEYSFRSNSKDLGSFLVLTES